MGVVTKKGGHPKNLSGAVRRKPSFKIPSYTPDKLSLWKKHEHYN